MQDSSMLCSSFLGVGRKMQPIPKPLLLMVFSSHCTQLQWKKTHMILSDHLVVPSWDPAALARFIEKFGTHIIVGVKMGGNDVIFMKQQHSSSLQPSDVQKRLKKIADKRFVDASGQYGMDSVLTYQNDKMLEKIGLPPKPSLRGNNWVVDATPTHCQGCSSHFTFINRKFSKDDDKYVEERSLE